MPALIVLLIITLVFIALSIACAVTIVRRRCDTPASDPYFLPFGEVPGYTRAQLDAIGARAERRRARDPRLLRRPLDFPLPARSSPGGSGADGGFLVPTDVPVVRSFNIIEIGPRRCSASREAGRDQAALGAGGRDV